MGGLEHFDWPQRSTTLVQACKHFGDPEVASCSQEARTLSLYLKRIHDMDRLQVLSRRTLIRSKTLRQVPRNAWDTEHLDPKTRLEVLGLQWDPEVA